MNEKGKLTEKEKQTVIDLALSGSLSQYSDLVHPINNIHWDLYGLLAEIAAGESDEG